MARTPRQQRWIDANRQEYGDGYAALHFPSPVEAQRALERRDDLLKAVAGRVDIGCGGSKVDGRTLSPGCRHCVAGNWSCLFINERCNARCFYCPTTQSETGIPATNTVEFRTPADYVAYLETFGFTGASISGGEPLLTPQRSLAFVTAIKRHFGTAMHVWLYTNGLLFDEAMAARLRDAGLDEIRFDIGANHYRLDALQKAVGVIPTVTVEIPAVPEELPRMRQMLGPLRDTGVDHLNLHQLRLTPYNFPQLASRGYTMLHGEKVTVLESELAALELVQASLDAGGPPVNYCSFVYKNRYQAWAARKRNASFFLQSTESLTASGYLRAMTLIGSSEDVASQWEKFQGQGAAPETYAYGTGKEQLVFNPQLLPLIDFTRFRLQVSYATCRQQSSVSYRNPFKGVRVSDGKQVIVEKAKIASFVLDGEQIMAYIDTCLSGNPSSVDHAALEEIMPYEQLPTGLQDYF